MEGPLLLGDRTVGTVRWRREGGRWTVEASCPAEPDYIYRLELALPDGRRMLGVMLPEHGRFRLKKTLALPDEPRGGRILRARPGEQPLPLTGAPFSRLTDWETAALVRDPLFLQTAPGRVPACEAGEGHWLALPLELGRETALAPFLCVCAAVEAEGRSWALFRTDGEGALVPPGNDRFCGPEVL